MSRLARTIVGVILVAVGMIALVKYVFGYELRETYEHALALGDHVQEIRIESDSYALEIDFTVSQENVVRIEGKAAPKTVKQIRSAEVKNGILYLQFKDQDPWYWGFFPDFTWNERQSITISLTEESLESFETLKVSSDAGSVSVDGAKARDLVIGSDSGSIRLGRLQGGTLTVTSNYGGIRLESYEGKSLALRSESGSIHADEIHAGVTAVSDSGSITINHLKGAGNIETDSGSIRIVKKDEMGAVVSSDSGSVHIIVPLSYSGSYDLKSDSGSIHHPDAAGTSGEVIKVRTESGSIRIEQ
ncbi:MAG: hypothetical protein C6W55_11200 [Thermobacillus sp.]|uniref:DUF4097 family beta strand repeat-containing protein n=1 Tax=Thermobacillus sp. TaxID=2108467 RepID=UPI000E3A7205|nr:DUF4097 family beta strand repeat-containing protein [Thermobacillus sp.]REK54636.1 MAG: hypothetical protein C6W55_11200 [Thermobacillus sp.]